MEYRINETFSYPVYPFDCIGMDRKEWLVRIAIDGVERDTIEPGLLRDYGAAGTGRMRSTARVPRLQDYTHAMGMNGMGGMRC